MPIAWVVSADNTELGALLSYRQRTPGDEEFGLPPSNFATDGRYRLLCSRQNRTTGPEPPITKIYFEQKEKQTNNKVTATDTFRVYIAITSQ